MITLGASTDLRECAEQALLLSRRVREDIEEGRLDRLERTLEERDEALRHFRAAVLAEGDPMPDGVSEVVQRVREEDRILREWVEREKQDVLGRLSSMKGQRIDPYREPMIDGPAALDQRR